MSRAEFRRVLPGWSVEVALWSALAGAFLWLYIGHFGAPAQAAAPHFALLALGVVATWIARTTLWRVLGTGRVARVAIDTLTALVVLALLLYYALVLIGLASWGKVVTWPLLRTYALQFGDLLSVLGVPAALVVAIFAVALGATWLALHRAPARWHWSPALAGAVSGTALFAIALLGGATIAASFYHLLVIPPTRAGEPFSLTFFPGEAPRAIEHHQLAASEALDRAEAAIRRDYVADPSATRRNVVLIVVDALRADHMGVYGYARDTTPFLSAQQRAGKLEKADRMLAVCSESACGLLALAQSRYVHQLSQNAFSLHQLLKRSGYQVHMILGGDHTNFYGLREAYGEVNSYFDGSMAAGSYMNDDAFLVKYVEDLPDWNGKPTFIQFHLLSAHNLGVRHPESLRWLPAQNYEVWARLQDAISHGASDYERTANYYDNGVLQTDIIIERLLDRLKKKHYLDGAVVAVTADHGEMLGEHRVFGHAFNPWQGELEIPFVLMRYGYSGAAPLSSSTQASQVDVAPTLVRELGLAPSPTWSGLALQGAPPPREFVYFQQASEIGLVDLRDPREPRKYWKNLETGVERVYDFARDFAEKDDLIAATDPRRLSEWRMKIAPGAIAVRSDANR